MCDVLLLERNRLVCALLGEILQDAGFDMMVARNPPDVLRIVHEAPPRVLVTNLGPQAVPEGLLLARAARSIEPELCVIYSTCRDDISDHHLRRREYCLLKPYDPNSLVMLLGEVLGDGEKGKPRPRSTATGPDPLRSYRRSTRRA